MAPKSKITDELLQQIREARRVNPQITQAELGEQFGLNRHTVGQALQIIDAAPETASDGHSVGIAFDRLVTSNLNPRKTFDDAEIDELAESIAQDGLLQNLVVRAGENGTYIVVSGERHYRALTVLYVNGRWTGPVPCKIVEADDAKHLVLALLENIARVDVPPLEEAQAFIDLQNLDPATWTAKAIAKAISRTTRYVYQRVALANKLSPETKALLSNRQITVEGARLLSTLDASAQADLLDDLQEQYNEIPTDAIRYEIKHSFIPTSRALFDITAAGIAIFEDDGDEYFEDRAQFWEHQNAAVEAKRAELAQIWGWVTVAQRGDGINLAQYITDAGAKRTEAGALIMVDPNGLVHIETALVKREETPPSTSSHASLELDVEPPDELDPPVPPVPSRAAEPATDQKSPVTKKHIYHAHARKTVALRAKIGVDPVLAMRLACYSLLHPHNPIARIIDRSYELPMDDRVPITSGHAETIGAMVSKVKKHLSSAPGNEKSHLAIWRHIESLSDKALNELFAALVARSISTPAGLDCALGDNPVAIAVAASAGLIGEEHHTDLTIQREDLNGVRKQTLLHLADEFGTPAINDELSPKDIADAIAEYSTGDVLPTLRFATTAEIEKALGAK